MAFTPPAHAGEVRSALAEIVAEHGPDALSRPALMTSLLADLMPDAPRLARLMVAAAQDRIAGELRGHVGQGMDIATAARLVTSSFVSATLYTPEACAWVVGEFAIALGLTTGIGELPAPPEPKPEAAPDLLPAEPGPVAAADVVQEEPESDARKPADLRPDVTGLAAIALESHATDDQAATDLARPFDQARTEFAGTAANTGPAGARPGDDSRTLVRPQPAGEQDDTLPETRLDATAEPAATPGSPGAGNPVPGSTTADDHKPPQAPGQSRRTLSRTAARRRVAIPLAAVMLILASAAGLYAALNHSPAAHHGKNAGGSPASGCVAGYVQRNAAPGDDVCVTPAEAAQVRNDNSHASERLNPSGGSYGPDTCRKGYVWRMATPTDHVCVTPQTRSATAIENAHPHRSR